eukprot:Gregarina_sp_Poly_1__1472@NODE_136_length_13140_cov_67_629236_g121_i0_p1_GENE_NODE_136_length_13140_cov_67_629236_g121_i0NODE_136_length_13140_cov_67_629236_g121_i0_p1_ORF_typecomplete_len1114_score201_10Pkinase/PF00069_25/1_8e02Pkinase/PF00069_25/0_00091Kinaselike/PF14531_6/0_29Kinaselike/PF14531_6/2_5e03Kinaselike/PF14531_6/5_7e03_NODE_136_length_13140_cov_67_629236_g121_i07124053
MGQQLSFQVSSELLFLCLSVEEFKELFSLEFPNVLEATNFISIEERSRTSVSVLVWQVRERQHRLVRISPRARIFAVPFANIDPSVPALSIATLLLGNNKSETDFFLRQEIKAKDKLARAAALLGHPLLAPFWLPNDLVLYSDVSTCVSRLYVPNNLEDQVKEQAPDVLKHWWSFQMLTSFVQLHVCGLSHENFSETACLLMRNRFALLLTDVGSFPNLERVPRNSAAIALDIFLTKSNVKVNLPLAASRGFESRSETALAWALRQAVSGVPRAKSSSSASELLQPLSLDATSVSSDDPLSDLHFTAPLTRDTAEVTLPPERFVDLSGGRKGKSGVEAINDCRNLFLGDGDSTKWLLAMSAEESSALPLPDSSVNDGFSTFNKSDSEHETQTTTEFVSTDFGSGDNKLEDGDSRNADGNEKNGDGRSGDGDGKSRDGDGKSRDGDGKTQQLFAGDVFSLGCILAKIYLGHCCIFRLNDILAMSQPDNQNMFPEWDKAISQRSAAVLDELPPPVRSILSRHCLRRNPEERASPLEIIRQGLLTNWFPNEFMSLYLPLRILMCLPLFQTAELLSLNLALNFPVIIRAHLETKWKKDQRKSEKEILSQEKNSDDSQTQEAEQKRLTDWLRVPITICRELQPNIYRSWLQHVDAVLSPAEIAAGNLADIVERKFREFGYLSPSGLVDLWDSERMETFSAGIFEFWDTCLEAATEREHETGNHLLGTEALHLFASLMGPPLWETLFQPSIVPIPPELKETERVPDTEDARVSLDTNDLMSEAQEPIEHLTLMVLITVDCLFLSRAMIDIQTILVSLLICAMPWLPTATIFDDIVPLSLSRLSYLSENFEKHYEGTHLFIDLILCAVTVLTARATNDSRMFPLAVRELFYTRVGGGWGILSGHHDEPCIGIFFQEQIVELFHLLFDRKMSHNLFRDTTRKFENGCAGPEPIEGPVDPAALTSIKCVALRHLSRFLENLHKLQKNESGYLSLDVVSQFVIELVQAASDETETLSVQTALIEQLDSIALNLKKQHFVQNLFPHLIGLLHRFLNHPSSLYVAATSRLVEKIVECEKIAISLGFRSQDRLEKRFMLLSHFVLPVFEEAAFAHPTVCACNNLCV